jgi:hypothetical protein
LIGRCSSSAPIVSLGADHRVIAPDRLRLVWTREKAAQLRTLPEEKRHALADCLFAMEAALAGIIAEQDGIRRLDRRPVLKADKRFDAVEAVAHGIAHEIDETCAGTREERIARIERRYGGALAKGGRPKKTGSQADPSSEAPSRGRHPGKSPFRSPDRIARWAKAATGRKIALVPISAVASKPKSTDDRPGLLS